MIIFKDCSCNANMSISTNCDFNGVCNCKENYSGFKCTKCANDLVEYPECKGNCSIFCQKV